ncbi:diiron oxygenase [Pseudomonas fulva]|uniref:diiron oxygenase n=1 Tax=Pseudomonas fulva TaxID=47880 RepID=UPI0034D49B6E
MKRNVTKPHLSRSFENWHCQSSVRASPYNYVLSPEALENLECRNWFPPSLLPFLQNRHIRNRSNIKVRLQACYLVHLLDYTNVLEHTVVNAAIETIAHNKLSVSFDSDIKVMAHMIYTDEGYHALFSALIADQIAHHFDAPRLPSTRLEELNSFLKETHTAYRSLLKFVIGFVSETVIANELRNLSKHHLVATVERMFKDHLRDEAKHALYFSYCFTWLWPKLEEREKDFVVRALARVIQIFCSFDERWLIGNLLQCGLPLSSHPCIVRDCQHWSINRLILAGSETVIAIRKAGILDIPKYRDALEKAGLTHG